jgi:hypothetical protein
MILMRVVRDDTMPVPGFEHHSFMCSVCHDVERRLMFTRHGRESDTEPMHHQSATAAAAHGPPGLGLTDKRCTVCAAVGYARHTNSNRGAGSVGVSMHAPAGERECRAGSVTRASRRRCRLISP